MKYPKKLIEVALPLDDINREAAREKSIRHGHPSTLHLWWARRPLAAARAVIFAQMVNDPGEKLLYPRRTKKEIGIERDRLFNMIRELVKWENTTNEPLLEEARAEIRRSWVETCKLTGSDPNVLPQFLDPFSGGGTIPLEAQRLGLESHGSDLNPVAVMIGKSQIEIPAKFSGRPPVGPLEGNDKTQDLTGTRIWNRSEGLAEDVSRYGHWVYAQAREKIGHFYPKIELTKELGGGDATVVAWIWARTVASPSPACQGIHVPLATSFVLSSKKGKETYVVPVVAKDGKSYTFTVKKGPIPTGAENGTKLGRGANFSCLLSGTPISPVYIKAEGKAKRYGLRMMAVVAEGAKGRVFLAPNSEMERVANGAVPEWVPDQEMPKNPRWFSPPDYGMPTYGEIFTSRQLVALTTFSDLVREAREKVLKDALDAGWPDDGRGLEAGGLGATAYADAVAVYLAFSVDRCANTLCSIARWSPDREQTVTVFARQAIPMTWDFPDVNPFSGAAGDFGVSIKSICKGIANLPAVGAGEITQRDAGVKPPFRPVVISTDPPYYDNIGYADLSDFFYVWMRRALRSFFPNMFSTMLVPKAEELVASPYRHGGKDAAEKFFLDGMKKVIGGWAEIAEPSFPLTIYYAFKQTEEDTGEGISSKGWETFLEAIIKSGYMIDGTWPMRTEMGSRMIGAGTNALASSIVLVCRSRPSSAQSISRKLFLKELDEAISEGLSDMVGGTGDVSPVAPVDLAQASIGPGIGVFSRYVAVLEADGSAMSVHDAMILINKAVDEYFSHVESEMDSDTRFCVDWFQQYGFETASFGGADVLARAKGTSVEGLVEAGVAEAKGGKVRLLKIGDYAKDWDPASDSRLPIWEACHQLARALQSSESEAGRLLARMPEKSEPVRQLAYRLYTVCERKGWAEEAGHYNALVTSWHAIADAAQKNGTIGAQESLL